MSGTTLRLADVAILDALANGPLTVEEIAFDIRREARADWAERHGYDFEWETDEEPIGARLLASCEARERGLVLQSWEIRPRLYRLERGGIVERIQIEGHRPMLWAIRPREPAP